MSMLTIEELEEAEALQTIIFPLIVPSEEEVKNWEELDLSKSALNACYSKPEINEMGEVSSWYEVEMIVEGQHDLPPKEKWFYIVTDEGDSFKAHFSGKKVRKLRALGNSEIIGRWVKDILSGLGYVSCFKYVFEDIQRVGIITKEMLKSYGGDQLILKKTNKTRKDKRGIERDIWFFSFPSNVSLEY